MDARKQRHCKGCGPARLDRAVQMMPDGSWNDEKSCLECAEKHLGAAFVMYAEIQDGYQNRMKVVGHLFKAEHEGAGYPALHDAIRAARQSLQARNVMPDWGALDAALVAARKAALHKEP